VSAILNRRAIVAGIALMFAGLLALGVAAQALAPKAFTPLEILSGGKTHRFTVELVSTADDMAKGLMYRRQMAADAGMLFDYKQEQAGVSFWMENTLIPLDMFFIKGDGTILNIHERAIPLDKTAIHAAGPVRAVLELNGGTAARLGLKPGDRVRHAIFPK
jgi:uncharacterized membrane protein (UPF0127 family)